MSVDRYGIMRPTHGIPLAALSPSSRNSYEVTLEGVLGEKEDVQVVDKPEWKSEQKWLHWDLSPYKWVTERALITNGI